MVAFRGLITPQDTHNVRQDMRAIRCNYSLVRLVYPQETECPASDCGYDDMTDSALKASCNVCHGLGKVVSWVIQTIRARVKRIDLVQLQAAGIPAGVEIGDAEIYIDLTDKKTADRIQEESRAYIIIDGERYRPTVVSPDGIGRGDEYRVELKRTSPEARRSGL